MYLRRGKIPRRPCEVCGDPNAEMHHDDYSKPLDIRWLCREHHMDLHCSTGNIRGTPPSRRRDDKPEEQPETTS